MESPFTPGVPASVDVFRGRLAEVERLHSIVDRAASGQPQFAFITGERGIGKSSLAAFAVNYARRRQNMATSHTFYGGSRSVEDFVRRSLDDLILAGQDQSWFERAKSLFGRVESVGLFGMDVKMVATPEQIRSVAERFPFSLKQLTDKLRSGNDPRAGLLLVVDETDALCGVQEFADWLKSTVDKMAVMDGPLPVAIVMVGLEDRRQELVKLVPSLSRVFDLIALEPWPVQDARSFFRDALSSVNMGVDEQALGMMAEYSGGLPTLAHEVGDAVFRSAKGHGATSVARPHVIQGLVAAAEIIGHKYIGPQVLEAIRGPTYLRTLRKLGDLGSPLDLDFTRSGLCSRLDEQETKNVDNFLKRMKELGLVVQGSERGSYRFVSHLARVFIWMESSPDVS